jgi:hypothetical protein
MAFVVARRNYEACNLCGLGIDPDRSERRSQVYGGLSLVSCNRRS